MQQASFPTVEKKFGSIKVHCGRTMSAAHMELYFQPESAAIGALLKNKDTEKLMTVGIKVFTPVEVNDLANALRWIADQLEAN